MSTLLTEENHLGNIQIFVKEIHTVLTVNGSCLHNHKEQNKMMPTSRNVLVYTATHLIIVNKKWLIIVEDKRNKRTTCLKTTWYRSKTIASLWTRTLSECSHLGQNRGKHKCVTLNLVKVPAIHKGQTRRVQEKVVVWWRACHLLKHPWYPRASHSSQERSTRS